MPIYFNATEDQKQEFMERYDTKYSDISFVHCSRIRGVHMYYVCPFAMDVGSREKISQTPFAAPLKANGTPYKSAKPIERCHGSNYNNKNRFETRSSHCNMKYQTDVIDDTFKMKYWRGIEGCPDDWIKRKRITKSEFERFPKLYWQYVENVDMLVCIVIDDNTIRETTDENQALNKRRREMKGSGRSKWNYHSGRASP